MVSGQLVQMRKIADLSLDEKATISQECFEAWAIKGESYRELGRRNNMSPHSIKKLISEYAAFVRHDKPDTRTANLEAYRHILRKAMEIMDRDPSDTSISALLKAKAFEASIQTLTRIDKLEGHEAPVITGSFDGETLFDLMTRRFGGNSADAEVSPMDDAKLYQDDDVVDAEIVE